VFLGAFLGALLGAFAKAFQSSNKQRRRPVACSRAALSPQLTPFVA
jgi:hypothetical protein